MPKYSGESVDPVYRQCIYIVTSDLMSVKIPNAFKSAKINSILPIQPNRFIGTLSPYMLLRVPVVLGSERKLSHTLRMLTRVIFCFVHLN